MNDESISANAKVTRQARQPRNMRDTLALSAFIALILIGIVLLFHAPPKESGEYLTGIVVALTMLTKDAFNWFFQDFAAEDQTTPGSDKL